jgi:hypothetical protein
MNNSRGRRSLLGYCIAMAMAFFMIVPAGPVQADSTQVLLDHFAYGNRNATVSFAGSNESSPGELHISIPRGAAVIEANVSVRGIEGPSLGYTRMDLNTHSIGSDLWIKHEEATGIYEPTVDPYNNTWDPMPPSQVANLKTVDKNYWHTRTPSTPSTAPWEYPIQLFHFQPDVDNATGYEFQWRGHGKCLGNNTPVKFHAEVWTYNHWAGEWDRGSSYWWFDANDTWFNRTIYTDHWYVSDNGSIDVAIVGNSAEVNNSVNPPVSDYGHLYTDYVGLVIEHNNTEDEYPEDVTLEVFNRYMRVKDGPLTDAVVYDDSALAEAIQAQIDGYPQQPGNVTVDLGVAIAWTTQAKVEIFDLNILYDSTGVVPNDPPEWTGPASVNVKEDGPWKPVVDLDQSFTDDHDQGDLWFAVEDISHPGTLEARVREGLLGHEFLEVRPLDDHYGDVEVVVAAADSGGLITLSSPITVSIEPIPDAPWLLEPGILSVNESEHLDLTLVVLDVDMPDDSFTFSDTSDEFDVDPGTGRIEWTPTADDLGRHTCTVKVEDSYGLTDSIVLVIDVLDVNHRPVITSPDAIEVQEGQTVTYWITAEDEDIPQGDELTYSAWSMEVDLTVDALTGRVSFPTAKGWIGQVTFFVRAEDSLGEGTTSSVTVTVMNINDPPTLAQMDSQTHLEGASLSVRLDYDDPDLAMALEEPEQLTITTEGPAFLHADAEGFINLTVDQSMVGEHVVIYTVTDSGGLSASIEVLWTLLNVNEAPSIVTVLPSTMEATEDEVFTMAVVAADGDGDTLSWSDDSPMFQIDPAFGTISFTPTQADVGTHVVTLTVSDGNGGSASVTFDLVVENVNDAPVIGEVLPEDGTRYREGEMVRFSAVATDPDGDKLSVYWREGDTELGTGTPFSTQSLSVGTHTITLVVYDGTESTETTLQVVISADDGVTDEDDGMWIFLMLSLILGIATAVLFVHMMMAGRKAPERPLM